MTAAAFSSAPSSSSPQPTGNPTGSAQQIFSPFQSQQQQQLLHSAQQPAMMELSGHPGPPSLHHHLEIMGECLCLKTSCMVFTYSICMHCRKLICTFIGRCCLLPLYHCWSSRSDRRPKQACECHHAAGPEAPVVNPGPARLVSIGNRLQLDLEPQGHARHHLHPRC